MSGGAAFLALRLLGSVGIGSPPPEPFAVSLSNPVVGQVVSFTDARGAGSGSRVWEFGDGTATTLDNPRHAYSSPGSYTVRRTEGGSVSTATIVVSREDTLRLLPDHGFDVTLTAVDPRDGSSRPARAIAQSDIFGYFSFPELTGHSGNPEVFVKMLDATSIGQGYWVFYGGLTSLAYTLTVRDEATGLVRVFEKVEGSACGGFDTTAFPYSSPTRTAPPTPTPVVAATAPPTPPRTPTRTPTPGTTVVRLRGIPWQWDFYAPGVSGGSTITLRRGKAYEFHIFNDAPDDTAPHSFSGVPAIGLNGVDLLAPGGHEFVQTVTPQTAGTFPFLCTESGCGVGHDGMLGVIRVIP